MLQQLQAAASGSSSSASGAGGGGGGGELTLAAAAARVTTLPGIRLSHEEAQTVCDTLARVELASRQAHRISTAAAAAFRQEADAIAECLATLRSRLGLV